MLGLAQDHLVESATEYFTDVLSNYSSFLTGEDYQTLWSVFQSPWAQQRLSHLKDGDFDSEYLQFGRLLLAFAAATVDTWTSNPETQDSVNLLTMLHELMNCEGYPVAEDEICSLALELWSTVVEFIIDSLFAEGEQKPHWFRAVQKHISQAIKESWTKIKLPDLKVTATWDGETKKGFKDFRKDVGDLLQSSYSVLGTEIFEFIVRMALDSLERNSWEDLEASLFCLNALSDCTDESHVEDTLLGTLFGSSLFARSTNSDTYVPNRAKQTLVTTLGLYSSFFERHTEYLAAALQYLFQTLATPALATSASKSIASLCSSCRRVMVPQLDAFIQQYDILLRSSTVDSTTKERVLGAIAAIIQALPHAEQKAAALRTLLLFVLRDVQSCLAHAGNQEIEAAEVAGTTALQCLTSIGKGLQDTDDAPIDVDAEPERSKFWDQGNGAEVQGQIVHLVEEVLRAVPRSGAIIEAACSVFRTGFTEVAPGPFVFPPHVTTQFLLSSKIDTPRLGLMLATACALISSNSSDSSSRIDNDVYALFVHVGSLIQQLGGMSIFLSHGRST